MTKDEAEQLNRIIIFEGWKLKELNNLKILLFLKSFSPNSIKSEFFQKRDYAHITYIVLKIEWKLSILFIILKTQLIKNSS